MFLKTISAASLLISSFAFSFEIVKLKVPKIETPKWSAERRQFIDSLNKTSIGLFPQEAKAGFAPFSGSKTTALFELNLETFVMLSIEKPGSPSTIQKSFDSEIELKNILQNGMEEGGMSTSVVRETSVAAQILGRIFYEGNVKKSNITYSVSENSKINDVKSFDGPILTEKDEPLMLSFEFEYLGKKRKIIYISCMIKSDDKAQEESLPLNLLKTVAPKGFTWGYISADGLIVFSKLKDNGAKILNKNFIDLLSDKSAVILDYPLDVYYNTPLEAYGFINMGGRAPLENWGLKLHDRIGLNKHFFGYSYKNGDEVRIYTLNHKFSATPKPIGFKSILTIGYELSQDN